jgi:hypothetical protein
VAAERRTVAINKVVVFKNPLTAVSFPNCGRPAREAVVGTLHAWCDRDGNPEARVTTNSWSGVRFVFSLTPEP